jgi:3-oxoadipate enol-lactonase
LLDSLAISQPVCLAGSAMGAGIAIAFATTHPTRVKRMAISSPAIGGDLPPMALKGLQARIDAIETGGVRAVVDSSLDKSYPTELRHDLERFQGYRLRWLGNPPQAIIAISNMLRNMDLNPALPRITCPTLVIGCQQDTIRPAAESAAIAAMIPESTYREAASGHFMAIQTPELFVQIVSAFLLAA